MLPLVAAGAVRRQSLCEDVRYCKSITILLPDIAPVQPIQTDVIPAIRGVPCD